MKKLIVSAGIALILAGSFGCTIWNESRSNQPDEVLFERGKDAFEKRKFDVAQLSLETLLNTYPDSDHVLKAKELLCDPRMLSSTELRGVGNGGAGFDKADCEKLRIAPATRK